MGSDGHTPQSLVFKELEVGWVRQKREDEVKNMRSGKGLPTNNDWWFVTDVFLKKCPILDLR